MSNNEPSFGIDLLKFIEICFDYITFFRNPNILYYTLHCLISILLRVHGENKRRRLVGLGVAVNGSATGGNGKEGEKLISSFAFPKKREFKGSGADYRASTSDLTTVYVIPSSPCFPPLSLGIYMQPVKNGEILLLRSRERRRSFVKWAGLFLRNSTPLFRSLFDRPSAIVSS